MSKDLIEYDKLIDRGLRSVVREALRKAATEGWPGEHHAYITFRTSDPGVEISDILHAQYPEELTIVLQHQYWGLEVDDDGFQVGLSFNKLREWIRVPFAALTSYADPAVKFGLQFQSATGTIKQGLGDQQAEEPAPDEAVDEKEDDAAGEEQAADAKVVTLDRFRKK
jgi:hypothetical protein